MVGNADITWNQVIETSVLPVIRPEYAEQFLTFRQRTSRPSGHETVIASPQRLHRGWDLILVMTV